MGSESESGCVMGAAGFIGSWLVMRLLERDYTARATVRDTVNMKKVKHLLDLPQGGDALDAVEAREALTKLLRDASECSSSHLWILNLIN